MVDCNGGLLAQLEAFLDLGITTFLDLTEEGESSPDHGELRRYDTLFRYGGEDGPGRPRHDTGLDGDALADRLYGFDNPKGVSAEWWQHVAGCRAWFRLTRDTATDRVPGGGA